jgi:hypothetical protein
LTYLIRDLCAFAHPSFLTNVRNNVDLQKYIKDHELSSSEIPAIGFFTRSLDDFPPETFFDYDEVSKTSKTRDELLGVTWPPKPRSAQAASAGDLNPGTSVTISKR